MYRKLVYFMISSVIIVHLLSSHLAFGEFDGIRSAYTERKCCSKEMLKFHSGKISKSVFCEHEMDFDWLYAFLIAGRWYSPWEQYKKMMMWMWWVLLDNLFVFDQ